MNFKQWLDLHEMPVRRMDFIPPQETGAWNRNAKRKWKWDDQDAGLLSSTHGVTKFKQCWANTEHNYDFYLVRTREGSKQIEVGEVDKIWIKENLNLDIEPAYDAISVIFTNNVGSEKMPFTCWTAAHRMGHAFSRGSAHSDFHEWNAFRTEVEDDLKHLLEKVYNYDPNRRRGVFGDVISDPYYYGDKWRTNDGQNKMRLMANNLGTMKSARDNNLRNHYEFTHELLAQYLLTTNKIQFNEPARQLIVKYAWGNPQGLWNQLRDESAKKAISDYIKSMADVYNEKISEILTVAEGRIWVM